MSAYDPDFDYLDTAAERLGAGMQQCKDLNDGLTAFFDRYYGSDNTDTHDATCNTCKHFQRRPMTPEEKRERNLFGMPGHCGLKDIPVTGWQRGQYCGFENAACYENRRTGKRPHEVGVTVTVSLPAVAK